LAVTLETDSFRVVPEINPMTRNRTCIAICAAGFIISVGVFIVSLSQQLGLVAALACLTAWLQLFIVFATVGDAMSDRQTGSSRSALAGLLIVLISLSYLVAHFLA
jgi:glycosyltransferase A (GT-A) superfamily protein (DUF2064 family)